MKVGAVTSLDALPLILTIREISLVYRVSVPTIRRKLKEGTFRLEPWDLHPQRWKKDDIAEDLRRRRPFRRKPAKAALQPRRSRRKAS